MNTTPIQYEKTQNKPKCHRKNKYLIFTSHDIFTSRKKMIFTFRYIKKLTLLQAKNYFYCLNKKFARPMYNFIQQILKTIIYQYKITLEDAEKKIIQYVVLEKGDKKTYSLHYAAKGRAYRALSVTTRVKIYIN